MVTAITQYSTPAIARLKHLAKVVPVLWSPTKARGASAPPSGPAAPDVTRPHALADGTLFAIKELIGKPPGLYTMEDLYS